MAYIPVAQRKTTSATAQSSYIPVEKREVIDTSDINLGLKFPMGSQTTTPLTAEIGTTDILKAAAQGVARGYLATGQAIVTRSLSKPFIPEPTTTRLGRFTQALTGTDQPISARQEDIEFLGERFGGLTKGGVTIALTALDLLGGEGPKGLTGLTKALTKADKLENAVRLMKEAGFADDIVGQYAPVFTKLTDSKKVEEGLLAAEKLQNLTKATRSYTPVVERGDDVVSQVRGIPGTVDPLVQEARKYKSADEFVEAMRRPTESEIKLVNKEIESVQKELSAIAEMRTREARVIAEKQGSSLTKEQTDNLFARFDKLERPFRDRIKRLEDSISDRGQKLLSEVRRNFKTQKGFDDALRQVGVKEDISFESQLTDIWEKAKASGQTTDEIGRTVGKAPQKSQLPQGKAERPARPVNRAIEIQPKLVSETISLESSLTEKSKVVNSDIPKKALSESTYEANRANLGKQKGRIAKIAESLNDIRKSIGEGADKLLGTISTRLKNIDPSLKTSIRTFEYKLAQSMQKDRRVVESFLKGSKDINIADYADLDLALKNGDATKIAEIIKKYGLEDDFAKVRTTLDDLYKRAEDVGYDIGYEKNYFPRMIKDSEGMLEYLQKGDDWSIIDEAIKAKETDLGRYLTIDEKANVINTLVRGYPTGKITLSETGAMKARKIDIVDAELNQFYHDSVESLIRYIDSTNEAVEGRRFFGKGKKTDQFANIDDSIGSYILNLMAKGKIKPSQEKELRDILQARFAQVGTSGVVRVYKNLSYIDTMGSSISAITQLGDLAFAIYKGGPVETIKAFTRAVVRKSEITRADIGIEKIAQEFEDASKSARAVDRVFRLVGLHKLDALGKETVINATIGKYRKLAIEPSADFLRRLELVFGDEADITRVMDDLKAGRVTEDTKLLAFNELLDVQPIALSEMPEQYLKGGNGRIFYMLKTYTIKLFDVYRNEVFQVMKTDKVQGMKNLLYLTGALVIMNATADEIKDFILNRETSLKDRTVDNILKLAGFSKFTIYKARQEGIGSAVAKTILPPFKFIDSLYKDIIQQNEVSQLETIQSIPIGGKLYYWWFGKGKTNTDKKNKKSDGLPVLPKLPTLPSLPQLPKF